MVSLVNFKTFDEDLSERRPPPVERGERQFEATFKVGLCQNSNDRLQQASVLQKHQETRRQTSAISRQNDCKTSTKLSSTGANCQGSNGGVELSCDFYCYKPLANGDSNGQQVALAPIDVDCHSQNYAPATAMDPPSPHAAGAALKGGLARTSSFTVTWRKLKFCIEPKWHEKIANSSSALVALASRVTSSSSSSSSSSSTSSVSSSFSSSSQCSTSDTTTTPSNCTQQQQQQQHQQQQRPATARVVLDQLDGSFRSGELTAILGPSGAGKTTLLDCLTGHRKSGLSGSIRFSSSVWSPVAETAQAATAAAAAVAVALPDDDLKETCGPAGASCSPDCYLAPCSGTNAESKCKQKNLILASHRHHHHQTGGPKQVATITTTQFDGTCCCRHEPRPKSTPANTLVQGDNLKVSIIPQNDHLIGHLTVYETLNYASKLKNCASNGQFDHKLNIKRVAQQLSLMSCLGTRINKLSGGQYKRVSIAQELLSSPDVLILDEPTSGLDAMTCFQTVQVLKKLTDDRRTSGQKSIAVILTIHQPNSDVFQQFNHVYVVAQGGKCIYEGPPGNIESVINRVGICLPNSYYNPATMIVEIAAGKFGQAAISKLNTIQRKQYGERPPLADEQNSTGDSAVDCPSSNYEDEGDEDEDGDQDDDQDNENEMKSGGGKVNAGYIMDNELDTNNNESVQLANDSCCVPFRDNKTSAPVDVEVLGCDRQQLESAGSSAIVDTGEKLDRRKRRRRMRRRASDRPPGDLAKTPSRQAKASPFSLVRIPMVGSGGGGGGGSGDGDSGSDAGGGCQQRGEKRLKLNSLKADQKFPFWRHTYLHFHRSWLSIVRDPLLCSMQLALHIMVPVMVSLVYGTYVGKPNACPRAGPIDIMAYAMESTDTALQLQEDLRTTLENIGYIFFKLYGIIFAAMTVTVLTFPLDMHVLVKEFRNGWYGLSSYFLGRTLADIPFQLTLPLLAMALSYYATGQPSSYLQWRFFSITAILILSSLIAQSQGLLFGAILMDKMKAAVFVAPAATTPIILFAGFLVRTQSIPSYLRPLSNLSYLRYAIEACLISRYGFNQCQCDPAIFNQTVPELPPIARSMLDYWLSSYKPTLQDSATNDSAEALDATANKPDLFTKLTDSLARANSFGRNITSCDQVVPYPMIDYDLKDEQLYTCFAILLAMLIFTRLLTFFIVCFKVKRKV